jgi:hypothetical protein
MRAESVPAPLWKEAPVRVLEREQSLAAPESPRVESGSVGYTLAGALCGSNPARGVERDQWQVDGAERSPGAAF